MKGMGWINIGITHAHDLTLDTAHNPGIGLSQEVEETGHWTIAFGWTQAWSALLIWFYREYTSIEKVCIFLEWFCPNM